MAALGVTLALSACAATAPAPSAPDEARPTATVVESTGMTLEELQSLYVDVGGQCATMALRANSAVAEAAADCDGGALLTTYGSESQRDGAIRVLEGLQESNPSPHVIAVGPDWIVNGADAGSFATAMGGESRQIGTLVSAGAAEYDLTTDAGLCAADAEMTNLELNDAVAGLLGYSVDRGSRTFEQDEAIREYKNAAFMRVCPARAD